MTEVGFGELIVRMLISLGVVLAIVLGAYALLRRRNGGGSMRGAGGGGRGMFGGGRQRTVARGGLRVVGRIGVGRTTSVVAVQFAERVLLIGSNEQSSPEVLAEIDLDAWDEATAAPPQDPTTGTSSTSGPSGSSVTSPPPSLIEALRQATTRRR